MKAKFLLSTLAFGAAFVACNNEDILVNETMDTNEIVGAKLLGEGLTMGIGAEGTESRATADNWENGDVAGIAWVAGTAATADQSKVNLVNVLPTVWANHFYQYNNGAWNTRSNIYEGWHFAYMPYTYQKQAAQLVIDVNGKPMTKADHEADVMDNAPKISAAEKLTEDLVDYANGSIDVTYDIMRFVNVIKPKLLISEDFTGHEDLNTISITGVTVNSNKKSFMNDVKIVPANLPQIQYKKYTEGKNAGQFMLDENDKKIYDKDATLALLNYANLYTSGAIVNNATRYANSETTVIDGEHYVLNGDKTVRMFLAPTANVTVKNADISFKIDVAGGHFDIAYTNEKYVNGKKVEYTATEKTNNAAIEKMVALLNGTYENASGKTRSLKTITTSEGGLQAAQTIEMALSLENFTADYLIDDIDDWNGSVTLANALNPETAPTFTLNENAKVKFTDEIQVPEMGVKVTGATTSTLIIDGNLTWNQDIEFVENVVVEVNKNKELTVEGELVPASLVNKGTILAGAKSTIGSANNETFDNEKGRVIVEYGAYVYPTTDKEGIIAYNVDGTESAKKINTLVATTGEQNGYAKVNTLIIANGVSLDFTKKDTDSEDNDRYHGDITYGDKLVDMSNVTIEMNGGSIIAALNNVKDVYDVVVKGGENYVTDINLKGDLVVEDGTITIDATSYQIEKVDGNGKVYYETVKDAVFAGNIANDGEIIANVDVYVSTIDNVDGTVKVTKPYTLWYFNSYAQGGTAQGNIMKANSTVWDGTTVKEPQQTNGVYQVNEAAELAWFAGQTFGGDQTYSLNIKLNNDLNMGGYAFKGITVKSDNYGGKSAVVFDGNNKTIKGLNVVPVTNLGGLTSTGLFANVAAIFTAKNLTIAKSELEGENYCGMLIGYNYGTTILVDNVTVKESSIEGNAKVGALIGHNVEKGTVTINNSDIEACRINAEEKHGGIFVGCYTTAITLSTSGNTAIDNALTVAGVKSTSLYTKY